MKLLVIEDDPILNHNIQEALEAENMKVDVAFDGLIAERLLAQNSYDCIVLDINLPGQSGFELCTRFRAFNERTPVLMLTAFSELEDKIKGFETGADDYLTKPFFMRELILRIQSLVKRGNYQNEKTDEKILLPGEIVIDRQKKKVWRKGIEIPLTPREYQVLLRLGKTPGEVVSKNELVREIWGGAVGFNTNTIEVYVNFLRNKIDKPFNSHTIRTKVGYGYYLETS